MGLNRNSILYLRTFLNLFFKFTVSAIGIFLRYCGCCLSDDAKKDLKTLEEKRIYVRRMESDVANRRVPLEPEGHTGSPKDPLIPKKP